MDSTENVDERLLAAVMDEAQTDFSIARIAVEKIRQGAESIAAGMLRNCAPLDHPFAFDPTSHLHSS
ncbi:hypothetical protein [Pseudomonas sp. Ant30-3]|uniref:hypothetical protein n=1 Tax=Pseudomonas sp. Ant30-3 TaxID=1488328 RepID=UPI001269DFB9|nr:hypothetical protein [Pseudomonas sp. Ant30-3]